MKMMADDVGEHKELAEESLQKVMVLSLSTEPVLRLAREFPPRSLLPRC